MKRNIQINQSKPLINAYEKGDIVKFNKLILKKENINCLNNQGESLIGMVIKNKNKLKNNKKFFDTLISNNVNLNPIENEPGLLSISIHYQDDIYYTKELLKNKINVNSF